MGGDSRHSFTFPASGGRSLYHPRGDQGDESHRYARRDHYRVEKTLRHRALTVRYFSSVGIRRGKYRRIFPRDYSTLPIGLKKEKWQNEVIGRGKSSFA